MKSRILFWYSRRYLHDIPKYVEDADLQVLLNVINEKEESILVDYISSLLSRKKYQGMHVCTYTLFS